MLSRLHSDSSIHICLWGRFLRYLNEKNSYIEVSSFRIKPTRSTNWKTAFKKKQGHVKKTKTMIASRGEEIMSRKHLSNQMCLHDHDAVSEVRFGGSRREEKEMDGLIIALPSSTTYDEIDASLRSHLLAWNGRELPQNSVRLFLHRLAAQTLPFSSQTHQREFLCETKIKDYLGFIASGRILVDLHRNRSTIGRFRTWQITLLKQPTSSLIAKPEKKKSNDSTDRGNKNEDRQNQKTNPSIVDGFVDVCRRSWTAHRFDR